MTFLKNTEHSRRLPSEAQRTIGLQTGPGFFSKFLRGGLGRVLRHQINPQPPQRVLFQPHPRELGFGDPQGPGNPEPASNRPGLGYRSPAAVLMPARRQWRVHRRPASSAVAKRRCPRPGSPSPRPWRVPAAAPGAAAVLSTRCPRVFRRLGTPRRWLRPSGAARACPLPGGRRSRKSGTQIPRSAPGYAATTTARPWTAGTQADRPRFLTAVPRD